MGYLERHDHGAMFYQAYAFNQHLSRWDVSSVTTMRHMFYDADAFNKMPVGWDTSKVTDSSEYFILQPHGMRGSRAAATTPSPWRVDAQGQRVRRVPPPVNGAVGTCTDTLVSGTSCVPTCDAGYVLKGVTSCTDRVLTSGCVRLAVYEPRRAEGAVDACLDAVPSGERCCSSDKLCWHPDLAMRRCGAVGCVDMPDWERESDQHGGSLSRQLSVQPNYFQLGRVTGDRYAGDVLKRVRF